MFNNNLKTAIVTGGTGGVGKELAKMFLKNNFNVIITGRNKNNVEKIKKYINLNNKNNNNSIVKGYKLDYIDIINSEEFINLLENKKIKPSYLVNNAGTLQLDSIYDITLKKWMFYLK